LGEAMVFSGQFFENRRSSPNFYTAIVHGKSYVLHLTKMGWDTFWVIFRKQSGHPASIRISCILPKDVLRSSKKCKPFGQRDSPFKHFFNSLFKKPLEQLMNISSFRTGVCRRLVLKPFLCRGNNNLCTKSWRRCKKIKNLDQAASTFVQLDFFL
jgi:hypothetical protein